MLKTVANHLLHFCECQNTLLSQNSRTWAGADQQILSSLYDEATAHRVLPVLSESNSQSEQKTQKKEPSPIRTLARQGRDTLLRCSPAALSTWFSTTPETCWFPFTHSSSSRSGDTFLSQRILQKTVLRVTFSARPHRALLNWSTCGNTSALQTGFCSHATSWSSPLNQAFCFL